MHGCSSYLPDFYWFYPQINSSQLVYKYKRGPRKMDTSHMIRKSKISNFGSPVGGLAGRQLSVTCWNNLTYFIFPNHVNIYCLHFLCSFSFLYCCLFQWKSGTRRKMLHLDFSRNLETFLSCIIFLGFLITIGCWKEIAQGQQYLLGREYECRPNCALNYVWPAIFSQSSTRE